MAIPRRQVQQLGLVQESSAEAILADGQTVQLETYACFIDWLGVTYQTQIVANDGTYPLLGTTLLDHRKLEIDYESKTVTLL